MFKRKLILFALTFLLFSLSACSAQDQKTSIAKPTPDAKPASETKPAPETKPTSLELPAVEGNPVSEDGEYYGGTVLLIDAKEGLLGVKYEGEEAGKEERLSFKVDPEEVAVSNSLGAPMDFADIAVNDMVDIYTEADESGKRVVYEIVDRSNIKEDQD